jgi:serine/threonine protein kinase
LLTWWTVIACAEAKMNQNENSWLVNWNEGKGLGGGGGAQGKTRQVTRRTDGLLGVLKELRHQQLDKHRARMRREVTNLGTLANLKAKVPHVLEDGTTGYEDKKNLMYFIMEHIPGTNLEDLMKERKRLTLEDAIGVTRALCDTMAIAHENQILHRDLKPANIMVRDFHSKDIVIVDFGLSFNRVEGENLTETDERVGNNFLRLPESGDGGNDKRDHRSDVTLLVGVFYYCLTGHAPKVLRDHPHRRAPHRRPGQTVRDALGDDKRVFAIDSLFDQGFQERQEDRFESCAFLSHRLDALRVGNGTVFEDPMALAAHFSKELSAKDRKTQLASMREKASVVAQQINMYFQERAGKLQQVQVQLTGQQFLKPPLGSEILAHAIVAHLQVANHPGIIRQIAFCVTANGMQCVLNRALGIQRQNNQSVEETWKEVGLPPFSPENLPPADVLKPILDATLADVIRKLRSDILPD